MNIDGIDLVYLWVDGSDPKWLQKRDSYLDSEIQHRDITGRYECNNELKYSLRSVEKNLPWIRKIFIVTDSQVPAFLNTDHPKITIIDHSDIVPQQYLPVFNSVVVEYFIHKIPDLSEHFLYVNDDMFVNQAVSPDFFFTDGLPIARMMFTPLQRLEFSFKRALNIDINSYRLSIENAYKLIEKKYGKRFTAAPHHNIDAYVKNDFQCAVETFQEDLEEVFCNRFRSHTDIQRVLIHYDALARKRGHLRHIGRKESCRIRVQDKDYQGYLDRYNPTLFCLNDTNHATDEDRKKVIPFLESLFPNQSTFEKPEKSMNKPPLVSVIIPVYNREKHIKQCLEIITNQTYENLEIIVVNDGSTDSSMEIAKQYPVKIIEHPKNRGLSAARNTGIDNATGKYIHFMDDDDEINLAFYENLVKASEATGTDISASGMISQATKHKTQLFKHRKEYLSLQERLTATYVGKWGYVWRYLFKLDFLKKYNLRFEDGRLMEDLAFSFAAIYYANKVVTVPNAEYLYVFTPNSIVNTDNPEVRKKRRTDKKHAQQFILNFAQEHGDFKIPGVTTGKIRYILRKVYVFFTKPKTQI